jgi:hypothetical protein
LIIEAEKDTSEKRHEQNNTTPHSLSPPKTDGNIQGGRENECSVELKQTLVWAYFNRKPGTTTFLTYK